MQCPDFQDFRRHLVLMHGADVIEGEVRLIPRDYLPAIRRHFESTRVQSAGTLYTTSQLRRRQRVRSMARNAMVTTSGGSQSARVGQVRAEAPSQNAAASAMDGNDGVEGEWDDRTMAAVDHLLDVAGVLCPSAIDVGVQVDTPETRDVAVGGVIGRNREWPVDFALGNLVRHLADRPDDNPRRIAANLAAEHHLFASEQAQLETTVEGLGVGMSFVASMVIEVVDARYEDYEDETREMSLQSTTRGLVARCRELLRRPL